MSPSVPLSIGFSIKWSSWLGFVGDCFPQSRGLIGRALLRANRFGDWRRGVAPPAGHDAPRRPGHACSGRSLVAAEPGMAWPNAVLPIWRSRRARRDADARPWNDRLAASPRSKPSAKRKTKCLPTPAPSLSIILATASRASRASRGDRWHGHCTRRAQPATPASSGGTLPATGCATLLRYLPGSSANQRAAPGSADQSAPGTSLPPRQPGARSQRGTVVHCSAGCGAALRRRRVR